MGDALASLLGAPPEPTPGFRPQSDGAEAPTKEKPPRGEPLRRDVTRHGFPADVRWCQHRELPDGSVEWTRRTDGKVKTKPNWSRAKIKRELERNPPGNSGGSLPDRGGSLSGIKGSEDPNAAATGAVSDGSEGDWFLIPMDLVADRTGNPKKYAPSDSMRHQIRDACSRIEFPPLPPELVLLGCVAMWSTTIIVSDEARTGIAKSFGIELEPPDQATPDQATPENGSSSSSAGGAS